MRFETKHGTVEVRQTGVDDDCTRGVYVDGQSIGRIYFGWARLGGEGWASESGGQTYKSQKYAALEKVRAWASDRHNRG